MAGRAGDGGGVAGCGAEGGVMRQRRRASTRLMRDTVAKNYETVVILAEGRLKRLAEVTGKCPLASQFFLSH